MKDKILFWFGVDFTDFCMSYYLKNMHDADFYAIVDITNKPKKFFQEQKLVPFKKIWFFHDHIDAKKKPDLEYLSKFEEKYNINIWKLAINERLFYRFFDFHKFTQDEILSIGEDACRLFESVLDEIKPDYIITKEPVLHHLEIFYELCKARGIKILMLSIPKIGFRCMISDQSQKISTSIELDKIQTEGRSIEELKEFVEEYNPSKSILKVIKNAKKPLGISKKTTILAGIKYFLLNNSNNIKTNYNYFGRTKFNVLKHSLSSMLKEKYRRNFMDKNLVTNVNYNSKFVYFPLGVDMERNILIAAPYFTNQVEIIRHIAKSLPVGYQLYVKEAPAAATRSWREISVYNEIMEIPNVTLIHPDIKSEKLLESCEIVSTIGGSTGFQAAFYKKPSIIFSETVYSILPSVFQVKDVRKLPNIIKKALETKVDTSDLDRYITLLDENTFEFDLYQLQNNFTKMFYYNGTLIDTEIDEVQVKKFLDNNNNMLSFLAERYQEKIEESNSLLEKTRL